MESIEIKAFVPARDFALSKRFYSDLGFSIPFSSDDLAYLHVGHASFLLRAFDMPAHARHFMMHLLVPDVAPWWQHVQATRLAERYAVSATPPEDRPWHIRDFVLTDPSGVTWRIGHNLARPRAHD